MPPSISNIPSCATHLRWDTISAERQGTTTVQTIRLQEKTGKDGTLSLRIPLGMPDAEYDVVVVLQPMGVTTPQDRGWPPGYFDKTFGSIDDESFVCPPQGKYVRSAEMD
jgi:hypothetical protein